MDDEIEIFDEEESNIHLVRLNGKVIREGECPLKKLIPCEKCEFYDGWGVDLINYRAEVWCTSPKIVDGSKLVLFGVKETVEETKKRKWKWRKKK